MPSKEPVGAAERHESAAARGGNGAVVPPTAVRLLPVLVATFGVSMLIDTTTAWPWWVRWAVAIAAGMAAGAVATAVWAASRRRRAW